MPSILDGLPIVVQKMLVWTGLVYAHYFFHPHINISLSLSDPEKVPELTPPSKEIVEECLEYRDLYLRVFHHLWYEKYLLSLRKPSKNLFQVDYNIVIRVGDVVVVKNPIKLRPY